MLVLKNITKTFYKGTSNEKTAVDSLHLTLTPGEFVTVIGSNGAGKSTLFNLISGAYAPDSGQIFIDDTLVTYQPEYRRSRYIGRLFQDPLQGTAPNMTIEENLALAYLRADKKTSIFSRISKADRDVFREKLASLQLGLENQLDSPVGLLSGGQRQALTLLMATVVTPKLLLLDEHTAALDPATAEQVLTLTREIVAKENITCLMITHNITSALQMGSRTLMMDDGKIALDITGEQRANLTVPELMEKFKETVGRTLDNDRMLLG